MARINIVPASVNACWQGKRFKTKHYEDYERELFYQLPKILIPEGELRVTITFGLSSSLADIDNPIKPFLDILQKKYGFNDKNIFELFVRKTKTLKGDEYIDFSIVGIN